MLTEGFHAVASGHIAAVVTHLEMARRPEGLQRPAWPDDIVLRAHQAPDVAWYRDLFFRVGAPWLWFSRLACREEDLVATLHDGDVRLFSLDIAGQAEAILELDFREKPSAEIAFFGLSPKLIGRGLGRALMTHAIIEAFARDIDKLTLHTCTFDSPQALPFYMRSGFTPIRQEIEVARDPRDLDVLPADAGAHIPRLSKA